MKEIRSAEDLYTDPDQPPKEYAFLDKPVKTNDPKALQAKALKDKSKSIKEENDLREVLNTQAGIRLMARILGELCYIDTTVFHPNSMQMANVAGRRQIGLLLKELIRNTDFEIWVKVDRELETYRPKMQRSSP